jgi:hypothetical protein
MVVEINMTQESTAQRGATTFGSNGTEAGQPTVFTASFYIVLCDNCMLTSILFRVK